MRIGQYTDSFLPVVDGVGRVVLGYTKTLHQMGHEPIVFAPRAKRKDLSQNPFETVAFRSFSVPNFQYRVGIPQIDLRFNRKAHQAALDIIHVHAPFLVGRSGLHHAKKSGIPVIGTFHSKYYDDFLQIFKIEQLARFGSRQVARFYEHCDETWAVTESSAETLRQYGYHGDVFVMPNGTDVRTLDTSVLPALVEKFSIDQSLPLLLYVGQLDWKKNIKRSLEAIRILLDEGIMLQMLLAGKGPHHEDIKQTIASLGLSDHIRFTGHLESTRELDGLYSLANLLVFPSLYDNGPMVVREAAAMGTPSLLIQNSSAAESIQDGYNGFTCEDTPESIAAMIRHVIENPQKRDQVGHTAAATIPVEWPKIMEQVVARYTSLVEKKKMAIFE